jgi:hypothetical protein
MKLRVKLMVFFVLSRSIAAWLTPPATKLGKGGAADHFFVPRQHVRCYMSDTKIATMFVSDGALGKAPMTGAG